MPLAPTADIVGPAVQEGRGVGAFNVIALEHAEALVVGAEAASAPVILQISENCVDYHGGLEPIATATMAFASRAGVPVALHLDRAEQVQLVEEAVTLGFGSVMFDTSRLDYADKVYYTRAVTAYCHHQGVWVEAELGATAGNPAGNAAGPHAPGVYTDPAAAADFVGATGVDALAVAVAGPHATTHTQASLDFALIARLREAVPVPLVLQRTSSLPDVDLARAINSGLTKFDISPHLDRAFTDAVRTHLAQHPEVADTRGYLGAGREAMAYEVTRLLGVLGQPTLFAPVEVTDAPRTPDSSATWMLRRRM
ncbi:MAG: class II fructose-bisphosphate aldolase [Streptomycetales bacterium]